jgi:hypothetical protein
MQKYALTSSQAVKLTEEIEATLSSHASVKLTEEIEEVRS